MSNLGLQMSSDSRAPQGPRHRGRSWLAVLLSVAVLVGIGFGVRALVDRIPMFGGGPEDYSGEGTGSVEISVVKGQTLAEIGQTLKKDGVVASVDAWLAAAKREPLTRSIGPGLYEMRLRMSGEAAVDRMIDPDNRIIDELLLREGLRIWETIEKTSAATGLSKASLEKAARNGDKIGLPNYADDFAEGFLFPATYQLEKGESATEVLTRLVDRWNEAADKVKLNAGAKKLGFAPYEIMIIASLVQAEGHPDDFAKVARVIYNRLDEDTWGGTSGLLQMDATVNYALKSSDIQLSTEQLQNTKSKYNTYLNPGLPPTPINSPGEDAMTAALHPADGDWLYYVTVNPDTGETKFTADYDEFLKFREELAKWHEGNS
ncbi:MAG: endolytic transglycosylase MltG [Candidatus Nanopelagicales bacterium]